MDIDNKKIILNRTFDKDENGVLKSVHTPFMKMDL